MSEQGLYITAADLRDYTFASVVHDFLAERLYNEGCQEASPEVVNTNLGIQELKREYGDELQKEVNRRNVKRGKGEPEVTLDQVALDRLYKDFSDEEKLKKLITNSLSHQFNHLEIMGFPRVDQDDKPVTNNKGEQIIDQYVAVVSNDGLISDPIQHIVEQAEAFGDNEMEDTSRKISSLPVIIIEYDEKHKDESGNPKLRPRQIEIDKQKLQAAINKRQPKGQRPVKMKAVKNKKSTSKKSAGKKK